MTKTCLVCGASDLPDSARYCDRCGSSQPAKIRKGSSSRRTLITLNEKRKRSILAILLLLSILLTVWYVGGYMGRPNYVMNNVAINSTLSNGDLASSAGTFVMAQGHSVTVDLIWVNCGIANRGPVASFRIYVDMADDQIQTYFAFSQVYAGWSGVARGKLFFTTLSHSLSLDPPGAGSSTFAELHGHRATFAGLGFNVVIRVWAEGSNIQFYVGECQFGIQTENAIITLSMSGYVLVLLITDTVLIVGIMKLFRRKANDNHTRNR